MQNYTLIRVFNFRLDVGKGTILNWLVTLLHMLILQLLITEHRSEATFGHTQAVCHKCNITLSFYVDQHITHPSSFTICDPFMAVVDAVLGFVVSLILPCDVCITAARTYCSYVFWCIYIVVLYVIERKLLYFYRLTAYDVTSWYPSKKLQLYST